MSASAANACCETSLAIGEPLAGTATRATRFLLVEVRGAWGRDPIADTPLPGGVTELLDGFDGRVLFLRRPGRSDGTWVFCAELEQGHPEGGRLTGARLGSLEELPGLDLQALAPVAGPLVLVCTHGRRDTCCSRLGTALYQALAPHLPPERLWQSSHQGGHRFAPSVLVLPHGTQFGRVAAGTASTFAAAVETRRIPLDSYRGRVLFDPAAQAAEVAVRQAEGLDALGAVLLSAGDSLELSTPAGPVRPEVERGEGPPQPASCGADPAPQPRYSVRL